jgi:chloramphenicol O-acetyltransferase type A
MREIDQEAWPRSEHFKTFGAFHYPHFNMCAEVDLTVFRAAVTQEGASFTTAIVYVIARAANDIPEFRQRIRGETVVEHDVVHPSTTILVDEDLFSFCALDYTENFSAFTARAAERVADVKKHPTLATRPERDDLLYMTAIPWVSFTSFAHPILSLPVDSVPRFAWGKFHNDGDRVKMPLSVQGHHALMDGLHVGRYYARVNAYLGHPETFLGGPVSR